MGGRFDATSCGSGADGDSKGWRDAMTQASDVGREGAVGGVGLGAGRWKGR